MATKEQRTIAAGMMVSVNKERELKSKPGGSNVGAYAHVSPDNFAGTKCGLPGAYPMDTLERAHAALSYAHNAKNPECIRNAVYRKWPQLKPGNSDE